MLKTEYQGVREDLKQEAIRTLQPCKHMGGHVLNNYSCPCVESPGLKTAGRIHAHRWAICPVPGPLWTLCNMI